MQLRWVWLVLSMALTAGAQAQNLPMPGNPATTSPRQGCSITPRYL